MQTTNITCANCRRVGPDLTVTKYSRQLLLYKHNRPYYALPTLTYQETRLRRLHGPDAVTVWLCSCCDHHLLEGSNDASDYWPGMIYKFLIHKSSRHTRKVSFRDRWLLIPETWKGWWETEFRHHNADTKAVFVDVTKELHEVNEAVERLEWVSLAKCMDNHFVYPEVSFTSPTNASFMLQGS